MDAGNVEWDREIPVRIIRSGRKTLAVEIRPDGTVFARAPYRMGEDEIRQFLIRKKDWIEKHLRQVREEQARSVSPKLSMEEIRRLAEQALSVIPPKAAFYAGQLGVDYGKITIRNQKTRWGSCSGKGNLNFNCLLMLAPDEVIDYVVVHELCHRLEMNHSRAFWALVERVLPDYKSRREWLRVHGNELMGRME